MKLLTKPRRLKLPTMEHYRLPVNFSWLDTYASAVKILQGFGLF